MARELPEHDYPRWLILPNYRDTRLLVSELARARRLRYSLHGEPVDPTRLDPGKMPEKGRPAPAHQETGTGR